MKLNFESLWIFNKSHKRIREECTIIRKKNLLCHFLEGNLADGWKTNNYGGDTANCVLCSAIVITTTNLLYCFWYSACPQTVGIVRPNDIYYDGVHTHNPVTVWINRHWIVPSYNSIQQFLSAPPRFPGFPKNCTSRKKSLFDEVREFQLAFRERCCDEVAFKVIAGSHILL